MNTKFDKILGKVRESDLSYVTNIDITSGQAVYNILAYGAKADGIIKTDGAMTAGSATLTSASSNFTSNDVGKTIQVMGANNTSSTALTTTIQSVTNSHTVVLTASSVNTVSGATFIYGTPAHTAINNAISAANGAGGGNVYIPIGSYITTNPISLSSNVQLFGDGAYYSKILAVGHFGDAIILMGGTDKTKVSNFEIDGTYMTEDTGYLVSNKCIKGQVISNAIIQNMYLHDSPATGLGIDYLQNCKILNNHIYNCGRLASGAGGAGIGIGTGYSPVENTLVMGNYVNMNGGGSYGIFFEMQGDGSQSVNPGVNNAYFSTGMRVIGNFLYNCKKGIGDAGCKGAIIANNNVYNSSYSGISVDGGTMDSYKGYNGIITNNYIDTAKYGILLNFSSKSTAAAGNNKGYSANNNTVVNCNDAAYHAISIQINSDDYENLSIRGNNVYNSAGCGIRIASTNSTAGVGGALKGMSVTGNNVINASTSGSGDYDALSVKANTVDSKISDNNLSDYQASPTARSNLYLISGWTHTNLSVQDNHVVGGKTGTLIYTPANMTSCKISGNKGFVPANPNAVTSSSSPYTYTAGAMDEVVYLSATTITAITSNGQTLFSGSATNFQMPLNANQSITITFTGTLTLHEDLKQGG